MSCCCQRRSNSGQGSVHALKAYRMQNLMVLTACRRGRIWCGAQGHLEWHSCGCQDFEDFQRDRPCGLPVRARGAHLSLHEELTCVCSLFLSDSRGTAVHWVLNCCHDSAFHKLKPFSVNACRCWAPDSIMLNFLSWKETLVAATRLAADLVNESIIDTGPGLKPMLHQCLLVIGCFHRKQM